MRVRRLMLPSRASPWGAEERWERVFINRLSRENIKE
jgi:hypothetical protein